MVDRIEEARRRVTTASDVTDDRTIRDQLQSVDAGLDGIEDVPDGRQRGERLEEIESKLTGLGDEASDDAVVEHLEDARDHIDAYRRDRAQNWETEQ